MLENGNIYVGERYLPIGAGAWDITKQYEQLVMVTHEGATYISTKPVPSNTELTNTEYWLPMYQPSDTITELQDDVAQNMADIADIYQKLANGGNGSPVFVDMRDVENVVQDNVIHLELLPNDNSKIYVVPNDKSYKMSSSADIVHAIIAFPPSNEYEITLTSNISLMHQPLFFPNSMLLRCDDYFFKAPLPLVRQSWCYSNFNIRSTIAHTLVPTHGATDTTMYEISTPCTVLHESYMPVSYSFNIKFDTKFKNIDFQSYNDSVTITGNAKVTFENCNFNLTNPNLRIVNCNTRTLDLTFKNCQFKTPCAALGGSNINLTNLRFENCKFNEQVMLLDQSEQNKNVEFINCTCYENHAISLRSKEWSLTIRDSSMNVTHSASTENITEVYVYDSDVSFTGNATVTFHKISDSQVNISTTHYNLGNNIYNSDIHGSASSDVTAIIEGGSFDRVFFNNVNIEAEPYSPARTFNVCTFTNSNLNNLSNAVYLNGNDSIVPENGGGGGSSESNSLYDCYFYPGTSSGGYSKNLKDWQPCTLQNLILYRQYKPVGPDNPLGWIVFNDAEITFTPHNIKYGSTLSGTKNLVKAQDGTLDDGRKVYKIYDLTVTQDIPNGISVITYNLAQSEASTAIHAGLIIVSA